MPGRLFILSQRLRVQLPLGRRGGTALQRRRASLPPLLIQAGVGRENPWFFLKNTFLRRTLVHKKGVAFLTAQMGTLTEQGQKCYILNRTYVLIWQNKGKCLEQMEMIHEKAGKQEQSA